MKTKFLTTILTPKYKILNIHEYINDWHNLKFGSSYDYDYKFYNISNSYWFILINLRHFINKRNISS